MSFIVALAGNPNSGKTSLFNELTGSKQHVGNWPGVTVDKKDGFYKKNKELQIIDLPGTYSLSPYSAEEIIARDYITGYESGSGGYGERPDVVINIIDATNIERNLYLTLQIMETGVPVIAALNMMDEVQERGDQIDIEQLSHLLGIPVFPIIARNGQGVDELMDAALKMVEEEQNISIPAIYDEHITELTHRISEAIDGKEDERNWKAIKLAESDDVVFNNLSEAEKVTIKQMIDEAEKETGIDFEIAIADLRYQHITKIVEESVKKKEQGHSETKSDKLDKIFTNRFLALPTFAAVMYLLFALTFSENFLFIKGLQSPGIFLSEFVEGIWDILTGALAGVIENASPWVHSLVIEGIMSGIGAVIGFIPLVLVLYLLISFLEDSGYMARIAFVMDRIFRNFGLSGRSFIPLLMGFGCGVPAITATRTLDSEKDRNITAIIAGFMPCGAKLPIFALFTSLLFADGNKTLITFSLYMLSIVVAIVVSLILNKAVYRSVETNFVMELPQYRVPTLKSVMIHGWEKIKDFAIKAGTVIFLSSILLWLLSNFNVNSFNGKNKANNEDQSILCEMDESFLAKAGNVVAPVFKPLGFGAWRPTVGIATGWIAKENVVVTFAQLYDDVDSVYIADILDEEIEITVNSDQVYASVHTDIPNKAAAYSYMAFNLLCMPCFAAVAAMKRELKTWKLTGLGIAVQMLTAYIVSLLIYQIGSLFV